MLYHLLSEASTFTSPPGNVCPDSLFPNLGWDRYMKMNLSQDLCQENLRCIPHPVLLPLLPRKLNSHLAFSLLSLLCSGMQCHLWARKGWSGPVAGHLLYCQLLKRLYPVFHYHLPSYCDLGTLLLATVIPVHTNPTISLQMVT